MKKLLLLLLPFLFLSCSNYREEPHYLVFDFLEDEDLPKPKIYYTNENITIDKMYKTELYLYYDFTPCDLSFNADVEFSTEYGCLKFDVLPNRIVKVYPDETSTILNKKNFKEVNEIIYATTENNGKSYLNIPILKYKEK